MDKEQIIEFLGTEEGKEILNTVNVGLLQKRDQLLGANVALKQTLEQYKQFGEPDTLAQIVTEYKALKDKKPEEKPAEPTVDPKLLAQLDHFKNELSTKEQRLTSLQSRLINSSVDSVVTSEIAKADGIPALLKPLISSRLKPELDDNANVKITVLNDKGEPMFKNGKEATVEDLINELKANEDYAGAFKARVVSGSNTRNPASKTAISGDPSDPAFNLTALMKKKR